jgi:predicted nucleotidyltransferase
MRQGDLQKSVRQVVDQIVSLVHPLRVILFGSAATGQVGTDSDLDFLVVISDRREVAKVADCLNKSVRARPMPCDFVVVTVSALKKRSSNPGLIYGEALEHGREVYAG